MGVGNAFPVALQGLDVRQGPVADGDRLCPLQVGVAGYRVGAVLLGLLGQGLLDGVDAAAQLVTQARQVEAQIRGDRSSVTAAGVGSKSTRQVS